MTTHRKLSVHIEHEVLLKLETAGFDERCAQDIVQSKGNSLAKDLVYFLKSKQFLNWLKVKEIVGEKNFFGPDEWKFYFPFEFKRMKIPEIPWSRAELESSKIAEEHFLFLGFDHIVGFELDLRFWHRICSSEGHPRIYDDWFLSHNFAQNTCKFRWYSMPIGEIKLITGLSYNMAAETINLLGYEVPNTTERVTANILFYLLNMRYLDTDDFIQTSDKTDSGDRVRVVSDPGSGLMFDSVVDTTGTPYLVSASRKM